MTPESFLKRSICDYLAEFPDEFVFTLTPGIQAGKKKKRSCYMPVGWPDITGYWVRRVRVNDVSWAVRTVPFFIEVKVPGGIVSLEQEAFLAKAHDQGCAVVCAYSLEDVAGRFHGPGA